MPAQRGNMKVGVAWYAEAEWQRLRDVSADPETLETTYAEWLEAFEKGLRALAAAGVVAERVEVNITALQERCEREGRRLDGAARSAFAAELMRRRYEGTSGGRGA